MHNALFVEVAESVEELGHNASGFGLAELLALYDAVEKFSTAYTAKGEEEALGVRNLQNRPQFGEREPRPTVRGEAKGEVATFFAKREGRGSVPQREDPNRWPVSFRVSERTKSNGELRTVPCKASSCQVYRRDPKGR